MPPIDGEDEVTPPEGEVAATPEAPTSLGDAISAALDPLTPKPVLDDPVDPNEENVDEQDGTDEAGDEGEGDEEAAGGDRARGKDGKFLPADGKGEAASGAAKAGEPKLGADGKPLVEPKKADPVNDPIPEEVKGRTRERMTALIDTVKAKDEIITNQHTVLEAVKNTGASPEEFAAMVSYMGWVHSDDPKMLTQARDMLMTELEGVSLKLGEPAPGIDFVAKFPDIKAQLDAGQITAEVAQELAINRARTGTEKAKTAATKEQTEATQAATAERNAAIADLDALGQELMVSDPTNFVAKHKILEPMLASLGMLPPKQWRRAFMVAYNNVKLPAAKPGVKPPVKPGTPPAKPPQGQPLRGNKVPSGGQTKQPSNLLDVVSAAIEQADQR